MGCILGLVGGSHRGCISTGKVVRAGLKISPCMCVCTVVQLLKEQAEHYPLKKPLQLLDVLYTKGEKSFPKVCQRKGRKVGPRIESKDKRLHHEKLISSMYTNYTS